MMFQMLITQDLIPINFSDDIEQKFYYGFVNTYSN